MNVHWGEPLNRQSQADRDAVDRWIQFYFMWYAEPIFNSGDYPAVMRELIDAKSSAQGFEESRLPKFTTEETQEISDSSDFIGINFYTTDLIENYVSDINEISYFVDSDTRTSQDRSWYRSGYYWLFLVPAAANLAEK